ncbi:MAG: hypothetical protein D8M59_16390 [Planctomycetes bacterium]|nr:hypothetical protein [Planctomycetota bacterium]
MENFKDIQTWIGSKPDNWRIDRIKDVFRDDLKIMNERIIKGFDFVYHYSIPAFDEESKPTTDEGESISSGKKELQGTGLLFSKLNCHKPRVWHYNIEDFTYPSLASTEFIGLRPIFPNQVDLRYFKYLLGSIAFIEYISIFLSSVTNSHKRINPNIFFAQKILIPPIEEQKSIADFLDTISTEIDKIIYENVGSLKVSPNQLETLEGSMFYELIRYRKSVIHEYVTGRKQVPINGIKNLSLQNA